MRQPEISTVLESVAAAQHDGILAFGGIIFSTPVNAGHHPLSQAGHGIYILLCDGLGLGLGLGLALYHLAGQSLSLAACSPSAG